MTPKLVAEIAYTEQTPDGHLRHPSFLGLREDKPAEEVVTTQLLRDYISMEPHLPRVLEQLVRWGTYKSVPPSRRKLP